MGGPPPGLIQALMADMMQGGGMPGNARIQVTQMGPGGGTIRISGGPGGLGPPPGSLDDDDDEDGIPPEILDMIRATEMMAANSGFGGGMHIRRIGGQAPPKVEDNTPRHEEAIEDIMDRMNKISDEIGEKHEGRYKSVESQSSRLV